MKVRWFCCQCLFVGHSSVVWTPFNFNFRRIKLFTLNTNWLWCLNFKLMKVASEKDLTILLEGIKCVGFKKIYNNWRRLLHTTGLAKRLRRFQSSKFHLTLIRFLKDIMILLNSDQRFCHPHQHCIPRHTALHSYFQGILIWVELACMCELGWALDNNLENSNMVQSH